jgi:hypothetical protein
MLRRTSLTVLFFLTSLRAADIQPPELDRIIETTRKAWSGESGKNKVCVQPFPQAADGKWLVSKAGELSRGGGMMARNYSTFPQTRK